MPANYLRTVFVVLTIAISSRASAQEGVFEHTTGIRGTRMWIPPGVETIKGILIYGNGAGGDQRNEILTPWNQVFAYLHGFALIGTSQWGNLSGGEINIWDMHLAALATASGHPELVHAPWAPLGFSNGGSMSYGFNALRPEKTIAFVANKGCCYNNTLPPAAALETPGVLVAGELDTALRRNNIRGLFNNNRPRGALWSWVEEQGVAHEGRADSLFLPFMAEAIRLRYPIDQEPTATSGVQLIDVQTEDGWLANQSTWKSGLTKIWSYDEYPGNKQTAGWLLNENIAFIYRAFSTYDRKANLTFDLPFSLPPGFQLEAWVGLAEEPLALTLELSAIPDWTKIQVFNYAQPVLELTAGNLPQSLVSLSMPIPTDGIYGLSALVTHADGVTISTTNPLAYGAIYLPVPEPSGTLLLLLVSIGLSGAMISSSRAARALDHRRSTRAHSRRM
jgi:hypothetical protein